MSNCRGLTAEKHPITSLSALFDSFAYSHMNDTHGPTANVLYSILLYTVHVLQVIVCEETNVQQGN